MSAKNPKSRFIVDTMHGDLARWLRILGYDTVYSKSYTDRQLLELALLGDRILITKDKRLYAKAKKLGIRGVIIESTLTVEKLAELASKIKLNLEVSPSKSRCPECNGVLERKDKGEVRSKVPPRVLEVYNEFYVCVRCGRVYWEGSHWKNIKNMIEEVKIMTKSFHKTLRIGLNEEERGTERVGDVKDNKDGQDVA
ncbi:MAG: Mut7-C RNAse domain-containing protein [Acidilobaceae archaeon]